MGDVIHLMTLINELFTETLKEITPTQKEIALINRITEKLKFLLSEKKCLNQKLMIYEP